MGIHSKTQLAKNQCGHQDCFTYLFVLLNSQWKDKHTHTKKPSHPHEILTECFLPKLLLPWVFQRFFWFPCLQRSFKFESSGMLAVTMRKVV